MRLQSTFRPQNRHQPSEACAVRDCQKIPASSHLEGRRALRIAVVDPSNNFAIDEVRFLTGMKVSVHVASESAMTVALEKYYPKKDTVKASGKDSKDSGKDMVMEIEDLNKVIGSALEDMTFLEEKEDKDLPKEIDAPIVSWLTAY